MSDFENVEDLIQRCTFQDFGMGLEWADFVKRLMRFHTIWRPAYTRTLLSLYA